MKRLKKLVLRGSGLPRFGRGLVRVGFCHHKCGTLYLATIFRSIGAESGVRTVVLGKDAPGLSFANKFYFHPNAIYRKHLLESKPKHYRGFHVIRDPRDVIVSGYFSHRYSHDTNNKWGESFLVAHRRWLNGVSQEEGMMEEIRRGYALKQMRNWRYDDPQIIEIKFEDLIDNPFELLSKVTAFLKIPITPEKLEEIVEKNAFKKLSKGREPGEEDQSSHFRKGIPGDWKNHFTKDHIEYFDEKWGDLLRLTGYSW